MTEFKPQETTMNSTQMAERELFQSFKVAGFPDEIARAVAHTFTQYMLSYLTEEGAAQSLVKTGIPKDIARSIVETFSDAKAQSFDKARYEGVN